MFFGCFCDTHSALLQLHGKLVYFTLSTFSKVFAKISFRNRKISSCLNCLRSHISALFCDVVVISVAHQALCRIHSAPVIQRPHGAASPGSARMRVCVGTPCAQPPHDGGVYGSARRPCEDASLYTSCYTEASCASRARFAYGF